MNFICPHFLSETGCIISFPVLWYHIRLMTINMKKQLLSVLVAVHKVRSLGVKNFLLWLLSKKKENDLRRELAHAYRQDVSSCPERGITLFGGFNRKTSLGKVARDLALALSRAGIPYQTFDIDGSNDISFSEMRGFLTPRVDFRINRYSHIIDVFDSPVPTHLLPRHSRIAFGNLIRVLLVLFRSCKQSSL